MIFTNNVKGKRHRSQDLVLHLENFCVLCRLLFIEIRNKNLLTFTKPAVAMRREFSKIEELM